MIHIDMEGRLPTDDDLPGWKPWSQTKWDDWLAESQRLTQQLERLHKAGNIEARNKLIDDNAGHWGKLKEWLMALSNGKCWFSETMNAYCHYDVEHFRPKKIAKSDNEERDGYWWLAFDYTNFRLCGNVGNRKKGGWFPLQPGSLCSSHDLQREASEDYYLLDPIDPIDVGLLAFDNEGKAIAMPDASDWDKARVAESVKRLKLNEHAPLTEARRKLWVKTDRLINEYWRAKNGSTKGGNPGARQKMTELVRAIKALTHPTEELSAVARWCVLFVNDKQLEKLVL